MAELEIMITGVAIVMGVLALLWALTALVGAFAAGAARARNAARNRKARKQPAQDGIPAHHLVAIAAAVSEVIAAPHRIVRVAAPAHRSHGWTGQARVRQQPGVWTGLRIQGRGKTTNPVGEP
ncbi:MAG: OadG family protein [Rhodospirillales bacterium]|nr:OadG family protein [Rhodospirillales bacterium]